MYKINYQEKTPAQNQFQTWHAKEDYRYDTMAKSPQVTVYYYKVLFTLALYMFSLFYF